MVIHIRSRGLYRLTMNKEKKLTLAIEKSKYLNRMDEAFITMCSFISLDLLFHISSCKTSNEAWTTMEGIFGKYDEMRGHMLEVEFLTLDPKSFNNLQDFFKKYKDLLSQLNACGVDKSKEEKKMVLTILSKLHPKFYVFVSTFHSIKFASRATWKMPSLEEFIESLTQEQTKLVNMGKVKGPKVHALTMKYGSHQYQKSKDKDKNKSHANLKKEGYSKHFIDAFRPKGGKGRKGEKCTYYHKRFHPKSTCLHKKIYLMTQILHQNNLGDPIPEGAKKKKPKD
jgi:hypothetical protein